MSKRVADHYLTDQNWDAEEEPQEAGVFQPADKDVLKGRVMKKAVRRKFESSSGSGTSAVFSGFGGLKPTVAPTSSNGFKGFSMPSTGAAAPSTGLFSFTSKSTSFGTKATGDVSSSSTEKSKTMAEASVKPKPMFTSPAKANDTSSTASNDSQKAADYNRHLGALNKSVSKWIADNVEKNPLCDLTPIFKDYQKHLATIDEKYGDTSQSECDSSQNSGTTTDSNPPTTEETPKPTPPAPVIPNIKPEAAKVVTPPANPLFTQTSSTASPFKGFGSFASNKPSTSGFSGFQFGSSMVSAPATSSLSQGSSQADSQTSNEEEYVPPKPDVEVVKEDDAFYTKKCKLFYMKGDSYADKGVGHIHLKPVPSTNKTQLIVRADTALGNLLLNLILNPAIPVSKQGKNNVAISCVPNPPIDDKEQDKVVPMLIRLKTSEDADELEKLLNEKKKLN
uniref:Nuclear pore complex protein Nup50 n=1 Tax=Phallusia mammillata TaxID=59560 RepID=A0A6F9DNN7_9ASCI|nr:nuclear pore complex protein Nup50 [Phallusia mammillata]